jgi:hypothetical protein
VSEQQGRRALGHTNTHARKKKKPAAAAATTTPSYRRLKAEPLEHEQQHGRDAQTQVLNPATQRVSRPRWLRVGGNAAVAQIQLHEQRLRNPRNVHGQCGAGQAERKVVHKQRLQHHVQHHAERRKVERRTSE